MGTIPNLPVSMLAAVKSGTTIVSRTYNSPGNQYDGFPYTFDVTLQVTNLSTSQPPNYQFQPSDIVPGMWLLQTSGFCYEIVTVGTPSGNDIDVTLKDVDLYNLYSAPTQDGNNYPIETSNGVIFTISDDGDPILSSLALQAGNLPDISYWFNDAYARFQFRNLVQMFWSSSPDSSIYSSYNVCQVV